MGYDTQLFTNAPNYGSASQHIVAENEGCRAVATAKAGKPD
jgi:hypothetical protein